MFVFDFIAFQLKFKWCMPSKLKHLGLSSTQTITALQVQLGRCSVVYIIMDMCDAHLVAWCLSQKETSGGDANTWHIHMNMKHGSEQPRVPASSVTRRVSVGSLGSGVSCPFAFGWFVGVGVHIVFNYGFRRSQNMNMIFADDMISSNLLPFQHQLIYIPPTVC